MSSASEAGNPKTSLQVDELHDKLTALQDMFTSTQPVSLLYLKGDDSDDPDLSPVYLNTEPLDALTRLTTGKSSIWDKGSNQASAMVSPTPSIHSLSSQERTDSVGLQQSAPFQPAVANGWLPQTATADLHNSPPHFSQLDAPAKKSKETA